MPARSAFPRRNFLSAGRKGEVDAMQRRAGPDAYVFHDGSSSTGARIEVLERDYRVGDH